MIRWLRCVLFHRRFWEWEERRRGARRCLINTGHCMECGREWTEGVIIER